MTDPDQVGRAYGEMADRYIELFDDLTAIQEDDLALIERHLGGCAGPVLDVGCGPGRLTAHLRSLGIDATGIDLVPEFVDHAISTYPEGRYRLGSITDLDASDGSVTGAVSWYSLIHTPPHRIDEALAEIRRVMAPGAPFVVGFFDGDRIESFEHKVTTAWRWPADELATRLRRAGFDEIERILHVGVHEPGRRPHATIAALAATTGRPTATVVSGE